ncbi:hypothetical protein L6452_02883 [Arctium lappa]|uniref:Uncharacterized protein n=1 Tax=Arctium lappa TaxID=4217 RepID=A0ACB9FLX2_ARCLA|nr:hypothetical protein L6452_02883 [Arctium lappa]
MYTLYGLPNIKSVLNEIFSTVEEHIEKGNLLRELDMRHLPSLTEQFLQLIKFLIKNDKGDKDDVEIVLLIILTESSHGGSYGNHEGLQEKQYQKFFGDLNFPRETRNTGPWKEKIRRLHILLTEKESAMDVSSNTEARRRISFFSNSLFMDMPDAPKVQNMISFSPVAKKKPPTKQRRVVVTRMGVKTPIGNNPNEVYNNLLEGVSGISENVKLRRLIAPTIQLELRIAGEIKKFSTNGWVAPKLSKRMDRFMLYMLTVGKKALADVGITEDRMDELDLEVEF